VFLKERSFDIEYYLVIYFLGYLKIKEQTNFSTKREKKNQLYVTK